MAPSEKTNPAGDHNQPPILGVAELSGQLKRTVEENFGLVRVRGEISRPNLAASGHCYLRLKDENAVLDGVIWRGSVQRLSFTPEEGLEVVCTGRLTTYAGRSTYQIVIERMEIAGEGALLKMIEDRRRKLAEEGLFDEERKQQLPFLPEVIGVVTSPTGAVIRDILHRLADRFPRHVLIWPVTVQGDKAPNEIAAAIEGFNNLEQGGSPPRPDLIIVARGGGSLEDLMAFNEEIVVRAAAASAIPLISAVGHETDTTLIDHSADMRAPTPTAAAEMAVPVRTDLVAQVASDGARTISAMARLLASHRQDVTGLARGLPDPHRALETAMQRFDDWSERLDPAFNRFVGECKRAVNEAALQIPTPKAHVEKAELGLTALTNRLGPGINQFSAGRGQQLALATNKFTSSQRRFGDQLDNNLSTVADRARRLSAATGAVIEASEIRLNARTELLESFSYQRVLERGFILAKGSKNEPIVSVKGAAPGTDISLVFHDGTADAVIKGTGAPAKKTPKQRRATPEPGQGSLL